MLKNRLAHLTTAHHTLRSCSQKTEEFDGLKEDTHWHSDRLAEYLKEKAGNNANPWTQVVQPAMKAVVVHTLESVQDSMMPRSGSFELFGFDFMVSDDLR